MMGQSEVFDPLLIEAVVLEALGGRREFPLRYCLDPDLSPTAFREFCQCLCVLDERIQVMLDTGGWLEISTVELDPNPPPGLEQYPIRLNGRRAIW